MSENNAKLSISISKIFSNCGIHLGSKEESQFHNFYNLIKKYNARLDLTRLHSFEDIVIKHFIDSVYFANFAEIEPPLLDIGTGPGFPGIPIKIMNPQYRIILAEPRHKRVEFLRKVIDELRLKDIEVYPHLVTEKSFFHVKSVITRALEEVNETLDRVSHFLPSGGRVIFMKGPRYKKDIANISQSNKKKFILESEINYSIPGTGYERSLLIYKNTNESFKKTYRIMLNEDEARGIAISSRDNRNFKNFKKMTAVKGIRETERLIVSGKKIIRELFACGKIKKLSMIIYDGYCEDDRDFDRILNNFSADGNLFILKKSLFNELDPFKTGKPLLVAETPPLPQWDYALSEGCNLIIPFQDPVNTGTLIRSAAGLEIKKIIMLREASYPFHPKCVRTSGGTVFKADIALGPSIKDLGQKIKDFEMKIITLDKKGEDIRKFRFPQKFLLLPGIEGPGLPSGLKINSVSIPMNEDMDSYNAAVSATLAIYEWRRER